MGQHTIKETSVSLHQIWHNPTSDFRWDQGTIKLSPTKKKRNAQFRTVQLSGRSQVIGQFIYFSAKVCRVLLRYTFCNQA